MSTVTILLSLLPAFSYLTDCAVQRKRPRLLPSVLILLSVLGLSLVVYDPAEGLHGDLIGYLCCGGCIVVWIIYGYLTRSLDTEYSGAAITLYQMVMATLVMLPIAITHIPPVLSARDIAVSIVLMGILSSGIGCLIEVKGLIDLGTTISGIYLNLLPVFTAAAAFIFLHEAMTALQMIGSGLVIVSGIFITQRNEG